MDVLSSLQKLGLTRYEAAAYKTLYKEGIMKASDVSYSSEVPRTRVYDVLESLIQKEWVREKPTSPKTYSALSFDKKLDKLREKYKRELQEVEGILKTHLTPPTPAPIVEEGYKPLFRTKEVMKHIKNMVNQARYKIDIYAFPSWIFSEVYNDLLKAKNKNVKVRIVLDWDQSYTKKLKKVGKHFEIKRSVEMIRSDSASIITDNKNVFEVFLKKKGLAGLIMPFPENVKNYVEWFEEIWDESPIIE